MKALLTCILSFSFPLLTCLPSAAYAQGWLWARTNTSTAGAGMEGMTVATDVSGNVFCAGMNSGLGTLNFGSFTIPPVGSSSSQAVWVKYDPSGAVLWADGTISGDINLGSIATDPSGNLILFGCFYSKTMQIGSFTLTATVMANYQYFLAKVSPAGTVLWAITDGNISPSTLFVSGVPVINMGSVATDAGGNIYVTGHFSEKKIKIGSFTLTNSDPSGITTDIFVARYNPSGTAVWATSIGGNKEDYSFCITVASTGNVYVAGGFSSSAITVGSSIITDPVIDTIAFIAKFSPSGVPLWAQSAGGGNGAVATGLASDNSGNVYMIGSFRDASISFGTTTISRSYPAAVPHPALFVVQYSPADVATWGKVIGSPALDVRGYSVTSTRCGQVWVSGNYLEDIVIDIGDILFFPVGVDPSFIVGYNLSGGLAGYAGINSGGDDQNAIAADTAGHVFLCGDFFPGFPFVVGKDTPVASSAGECFFIAKYAIVIDTTVGKVTSLCETPGGITLTATPGYANYVWDNGSTASTRTVIADGKYFVYCIECDLKAHVDTFNVYSYDTTTKRQDSGTCALAAAITLNAPSGYSTYLWNTGATATSIVATKSGSYWSYASKGCTTLIDTFRVTFIPPSVATMAKDTSICISVSQITLTAPPGFSSCLWSTGATTTYEVVNGSGTYWFQATKDCFVQADTFTVTFIPFPTVTLGNDTGLCVGDQITLASAQPSGSTYMWNTGNTTESIIVVDTGKYELTVDNGYCRASASVNIFELSPPAPFSLGSDTTLCIGDMILLSVNANAVSSLWSDGSNDQSINVTETGTYWTALTNICGISTDTINVNFEPCNIGFPSAFTPNGDGKNDIIRAFGSFNFFKDFSLSIFNRYGQRVFYTEDIYAGWDGIFNGTQQTLGTYFYMIRYSLEGKNRLMKGDFQLIR